MAERATGPDGLSLIFGAHRTGRGDLAPTGCPLTSTCVLWYAKNATGRTLMGEGRGGRRKGGRNKQQRKHTSEEPLRFHTQPKLLHSRAVWARGRQTPGEGTRE